MTSQADKASQFKSLHVPGNPVVLFNIWDAGSAQAVERSGAQAIATGSAPVAMANGYPDGEQFSLEDAITVVSRILRVTQLPVTMDLEGGYSSSPDGVAGSVQQAIAAGAIGFNFEDQVVGGQGLYSVADQCERLKAARKAADADGVNGFINARTDVFLKAKPEEHSDQLVDEAIERAKAFEQAGADGFFAPGMVHETQIEKLIKNVNLPVNLIVLPHTPSQQTFADLGAARVSYGPTPYRRMIAWLENEAADAYDQ